MSPEIGTVGSENGQERERCARRIKRYARSIKICLHGAVADAIVISS